MSSPTSPASVELELPPGTEVGGDRFVVQEVLGRGGFGITYAADDRRLQRRVAVKALTSDHARSRFLREASVLARFSHPGIVRVYEVFEDHGTAYLVMELLEGRTLSEVQAARRGPFPEGEVLEMAVALTGSLSAVHDAGVLHRDLKPSNVMVAQHGRIVLIDFGIARPFTPEHTGPMTRVITPGYSPPEQYLGEARFGPAADVYGLAATLYRLLTHQAPLAATDRLAGAALPPPHRLNPDVSPATSAAVLDGLELRAEHRPQTMDAFAARLALGTSAQTPVAPPTRPVPPVPTVPPSWPRIPASAGNSPPGRVGAKGRWKVRLPWLAATAALASAAPVVVAPLLALLVLPGVATAGDALRFVHRRGGGGALRWFHGLALPAFLVLRFLRNLPAVLLTTLPALLLGAAVIGVTLLAQGIEAAPMAEELVLRLGGAAVALLLVEPVFSRRWRFAAADVGDAVVARSLDPGARLTGTGRVLLLVLVAATIAGVGFRPELWPLGP